MPEATGHNSTKGFRPGDTTVPEVGRAPNDPPEWGGLADLLIGLELVDPAEFQVMCTDAGGDTCKLLDDLRRRGALTPFQVERAKKSGAESIRFDDYVLVDKLGEGGAGEVFKARNVGLGRMEAIKTIQADGPNRDALSKRFQREARVLAQLEHPGVVPIHKIGHYKGIDYIAMKYVEGKTLQKRIDESRESGVAIPWSTALRWILEAAKALDYAHQHKIVHRDIKPGNLMVTNSGTIVVLDMGIARLTDPMRQSDNNITVANRGMGTPEYMPPEQWADARSVTPSSDIYSLGCTMIHLLTGRPPYAGRKLNELLYAHATAAVPKLSQKRPDLPIALDGIAARMLAKQQLDRYASAAELIADLEGLLRYASKDPPSPISAPQPPQEKLETTKLVGKTLPTTAPPPQPAQNFVELPNVATRWREERPRHAGSMLPLYSALFAFLVVLIVGLAYFAFTNKLSKTTGDPTPSSKSSSAPANLVRWSHFA